jgi:hypothetical protein
VSIIGGGSWNVERGLRYDLTSRGKWNSLVAMPFAAIDAQLLYAAPRHLVCITRGEGQDRPRDQRAQNAVALLGRLLIGALDVRNEELFPLGAVRGRLSESVRESCAGRSPADPYVLGTLRRAPPKGMRRGSGAAGRRVYPTPLSVARLLYAALNHWVCLTSG